MVYQLKIKISQQRGQAITEFNVTAAFVLIPLFIMIPLLGKYIDMKHASVQAARYMAWERTVWFDDSSNPEKNTVPNEVLYPSKRASTIARKKRHDNLVIETRQRFFGSVMVDDLNSTDDGLNPLWNDRGTSIIKSEDDVNLSFFNGGNENVLAQDSDDTNKRSFSYRGIELFSRIVGNVSSILGTALNAAKIGWNALADALPIPFPTFNNVNGLFDDVMDNYQFKGYYRSRVAMEIDNDLFNNVFDPEGKNNLGLPLVFDGRAAVLTDSWVVGNDRDEQFMAYTKTFVPFAPLEEFWAPIRDIVTYEVLGIALAPEMAGLELGFVDTVPVKDSSETPDCDGGLCSYP